MDNNNSPDLGGLNIGTNTDSGNNPANTASSPSAQIVAGRKTRSDAGKPRGARGESTKPSVVAISEQQFKTLYSPQLWEKVLTAPADGMAALTGKAHWQVSEPERKMLGETGSVAAQCFAVSDPRWLAVSLALIALIDVYGMRLAKDYAEKKAAEKKPADLHVIKKES